LSSSESLMGSAQSQLSVMPIWPCSMSGEACGPQHAAHRDDQPRTKGTYRYKHRYMKAGVGCD
jgi:hypothetical protein